LYYLHTDSEDLHWMIDNKIHEIIENQKEIINDLIQNYDYNNPAADRELKNNITQLLNMYLNEWHNFRFKELPLLQEDYDLL